MDFAIETDGLTRRFGSFVAVDAVSLKVAKGEIFGFLGANGAGKTTLIRMLCGLLEPSGGTGLVWGLDVNTQPDKIKSVIGYMSQKFSLYNDLTPLENIRFWGGIQGLKTGDIKERGDELISRLGLTEYRSKLVSSLPLGIKQRLALACALLHRPPILFLDEPTSGVDPKARSIFWEEIRTLAEGGVTVFVTTHYMDEAQFCGRISIMDKGKIIALESPTALVKRHGVATVQEAFIAILKENRGTA